MRDFTGVLLAADLDGTLLDSRQRVSPGNAEAIHDFIRRGGRFTLATGRTMMAVECVRPLIPINAPAILLNGALIYDYASEKMLYAEPLLPETRALAGVVHERWPDLGVEILAMSQKFAVNRNAQIQWHLNYVHCTATDLDDPMDAPGEWFKILCVDTPERLAPVWAFLNEHYGGSIDLCYSSPTLLEIQNKGLTKGAGLTRLATLLDVKEVYCAGDNGNDLPMMRAYPSFAPANAIDECKQAATAVGPSHEEDFLAFVIGELEKR